MSIQPDFFLRRALLTILFFCVILTVQFESARAQVTSNQGTEFWTVFPTHVPNSDSQLNTELADLSVFITSSEASSGNITAPGFSQIFSVLPNKVTEIKIPRNNIYINDTESGAVLPNRAIHILVDPGKPKIVVYTHIFAGQRSAATLVLPKESLGQQYYSMNYQEHDTEGKNFIIVVATEPNTKIRIKKGNTELVTGGITLKDVNDVYEYLSPGDLTGVSVAVDPATSACNHFEIFSGSSGTYIGKPGCEPASLDPLFQQCYPVESWGSQYGFIPFSMVSPNFSKKVRTAGQFVRVLAQQDLTVVEINGHVVASLNAGEYYTTPDPLNTAAQISANKPISVAQYALTQSCSNLDDSSYGYSDPDMVILNPVQYNIKDITVYSSTRENIAEQYINVLMQTSATSSFKVNGQSPPSAFTPLAGLPGYAYLQLNLNKYNTNNFHLSANDGFNTVAYGFGDVESYSYAAGTNLASNGSFDVVRSADNQPIDSACVNQDYYFRLILPYKTPQITWQMDAKEKPAVQNNPMATVVVINGKTAYQYLLAKTPAYQFAGLHQITISAGFPLTLGGCTNGGQVINSTFMVQPLPVAGFSYQADACGRTITFNDQSKAWGYKIVSWLWDFGDTNNTAQNTSTDENPTYTYMNSGTYNIKLTVTYSSGCQSYMIQTLKLAANVVPKFITTSPVCLGSSVGFTDVTNETNFKTAKWKWDFGDGKSTEATNKLQVFHHYQSPGNYEVRLSLTSYEGCVSDNSIQTITVNAVPIPDFSTSLVCVSDEYTQFFDQSQMSDNSKPALSYVWDFGDAYGTTLNPNISTDQNPKHKYKFAGSYKVSLTVTSPLGCSFTIQKNVMVNGSEPQANFDMLSAVNICSGQSIIVKDRSDVSGFGTITKLVWYFDAVNSPGEYTTVESPKQGATYTHTYSLLATADQPLNYVVRLVAYSGNVCFNSIEKTVTVYPPPKVKFDDLPKVCLSTAAFKITQARETTGIKGDSGRYSGDGTTSDGMFDPSAAGAGAHVITYQFISAEGCTASASQTITVLNNPTVGLPGNIYLLKGQSITLNPVYSPGISTYTWTPSDGLNSVNDPYPRISPKDNVDYTVTVSNGGCESSAAVHVTVLKPPIIPNAFTPNDDGINDRWEIPNLVDYPKATVAVFNRYGAKIFYSAGYPVPWDGRYRGSSVPNGTYYYIINTGMGQNEYSGWVVVQR